MLSNPTSSHNYRCIFLPCYTLYKNSKQCYQRRESYLHKGLSQRYSNKDFYACPIMQTSYKSIFLSFGSFTWINWSKALNSPQVSEKMSNDDTSVHCSWMCAWLHCHSAWSEVHILKRVYIWSQRSAHKCDSQIDMHQSKRRLGINLHILRGRYKWRWGKYVLSNPCHDKSWGWNGI